MGGLVSYFWGATQAKAVEDGEMTDTDTPDKTTGLTGMERKLVIDSWALVKKNVKQNGVDLFICFFTKFPENQSRFTGFSDVPLSELRENKKLMAHAMSVMYAITAVVDNLNDPDCLIHMLTLLGSNHQKRKIPEKSFEDLKKVLLSLLKEKLGGKMTQECTAAWNKTLTVAYSVIFKGMSDAEAAASGSKSKN